ncbi:MAG: hydrogen peroxide-inducible genes activator [Burkholderiales bacterium]
MNSALPTLRQLKHLVALAEHRHFGRAAQASFVTQSAFSSSIQDLEAALAAQLVDRSKRSVVFTPLGLEVVERARGVLRDARELTALAQSAREPLTGTLRLGVIPTISPFLLPRVLPALRKAHPKLKLYLTEDQTARLVEGLANGRLDVLLVALPCSCGSADTLILARDDFSVALPKDHALTKLKTVPPETLRGEQLLLLQDGHCLRDQALSACGMTDPERTQAFEGTSLQTLTQMVANGLGVTLVPRMALEAGILRGTNVVTRPLAGGAAREIGLAWRRGTGRKEEFMLLGATLKRLMAEAHAKAGGKK